MDLIADEGIDKQIVDALRDRGHDIVYIAESAPGASDESILRIANSQDRLLLTSDKDFGELVYRQRLATRGVVLIRLAGLSNLEKSRVVTAAIEKHHAEFSSAFSVISPGSMRIRRMLDRN